MRIFDNAKQLISEINRDVWEMGVLVHPKSMQDKDVSADPNFETKEILNYSYCLTKVTPEDIKFLMGDNEGWVNEEFNERISRHEHGRIYNPGSAWALRKNVWEKFLESSRTFSYTYSERIGAYNSLTFIISELIRNPDSRQAILSIWDPRDITNIGGKRRVPCSIYYQFIIRSGILHIIYNQRSADVITHFKNDIALALLLRHYVFSQILTNLPIVEGFLYHNITSLHCYKKDWHGLQLAVDNVSC